MALPSKSPRQGRRGGAAAIVGLLVTALGPQSVPAAPPETYVMLWSADEDRHADDGATNLRHDVEVKVELRAAQRVVVTDSGTYSDHSMDSNGGNPTNHTDKTRWRNLWSGTWSLHGDKLQLALLLDGRECQREELYNDEPPKRHRCRAVSRQLDLTCRSETVTTDYWSKQVPVAVWTCEPTGSPSLAQTPSRWVLGKLGCVQVLAGRGPAKYRPCGWSPGSEK